MSDSKLNIAIIGASGGIGSALVRILARQDNVGSIHACSRSRLNFALPNVFTQHIDLEDENTIEQAAVEGSTQNPYDLVIVATGILHDGVVQPEKALRDLSAEKFSRVFSINTIGPALVAKHYLPQLNKDRRSLFAAITARVGSISDNHLGGWYAYRASKAALNMIIRNASIEMARRNKAAIIVGLHPGTVESELSEPFRKHVPQEKLFTPEYSATRLLSVINDLKPEDNGKFFAWDGTGILP